MYKNRLRTNSTFSQCAYSLLEVKIHTLSKTSFNHLSFFFNKKLIPYFGKMKIRDINENTVNAYIASEIGFRKLSDDIKYIRMILKFAHNEGITNRVISIRNPDAASTAGKYVSQNEIKKLLFHCFDDDMRLQINMAYIMGMRRSEICHLRWEFIDLTNYTITLPPWFLKTRRMVDRIIPIHEIVAKMLRVRKREVFLFPSQINLGEPIRDNKSSWKRLKKRAGVKCRFHDLRHTCITNLVMANVHVLTIRQICGVSPQVMRRYSHVPLDELKDSLNRGYKKAA